MSKHAKVGLSALFLALAWASATPAMAQFGLRPSAVTASPAASHDPKASATASAQAMYEQGANAVKRAFARRAAVFQPGTFNQLELPTSMGELFSGYGFRPPPGVVVTPLPIDGDRMGFCISARANNAEQWAGFVRAVAAQELEPAAKGCSVLTGHSTPAAYPVDVEGILALDRREVPPPSAQQPPLQMEGGEPDDLKPVPVGDTALVIKFVGGKGQAQVRSVYVRNLGGLGVLRLVQNQATPGFSVQAHACDSVAEQQACEVQVRFAVQPGGPSTVGGRVRLMFEQVLPPNAPPASIPLRVELSASLAGIGLHRGQDCSGETCTGTGTDTDTDNATGNGNGHGNGLGNGNGNGNAWGHGNGNGNGNAWGLQK